VGRVRQNSELEAETKAAWVAAAAIAAEAKPPVHDERFLGEWHQIGIEANKLGAILKTQGYSWPVRKVAVSTKLNMTFSIDRDGDIEYFTKVPPNTVQRLKCVNGASIELKLLGTRMLMSAKWSAEGSLVIEQATTSGSKTTRATITLKYQPQTDTLLSENDSVEGFYTRTFARR